MTHMYNDIQQDTQHNDTQHYYIQFYGIQDYDIQHENVKSVTLYNYMLCGAYS